VTLAARLGVGDRALVAFVGAGGKSTLLLSLGHELRTAGRRVVLSTTTKMGADQIPEWAVPVGDTARVRSTLAAGKTPFLVGAISPTKIAGVKPEMIDEISTWDVEYVLVEADGARGRRIKTPAPHEPVIPDSVTRVVVVVSMDAIGCSIADVAHRPERVAALLGCGVDHMLTPANVVDVVANPEGGLARIPNSARVTVALTSVAIETKTEAAERTVGLLRATGRIDRVTIVPDLRPGFT